MVTSRHGKVLVCHPNPKIRERLAQVASSYGNSVLETATIPDSNDFDVVITHPDDDVDLPALRKALQRTSHRVIPLITDQGGYVWLQQEKHICRDMTASGGNIDLLMR